MHTRQGLAQGFALFDSGAAAQAALRTIANLPCALLQTTTTSFQKHMTLHITSRVTPDGSICPTQV